LLDTMPGCNALAGFADQAAGVDDRFDGAGDDEVAGVIAAWDRVEAHASARKHAAIAEFTRRRPEPGCSPEGPAQMPAAWDEFTVTELAAVLGESRGAAEGLLDLAHDLEVKLPGTRANAAAHNPTTTWCVTVTDQDGHAVGHGCARPEPKNRQERVKRRKSGPPDGRDPPGGTRDATGPGFSFTAASQHGPPGGYGAWALRTGGDRAGLIVALDPITTGDCDHRYQAKGHDPGVKLRHLSQIRHATCTSPVCRRPAAQCDFEHNIPHEAGGRTCLCNGGPKCRRDHRLKQHPRWKADQLPDGTFRWTTPSGRQYVTEATRYPI
jgi:hypothetical protein